MGESSDVGLIGRGGRRCARQVVRRWGGVSIGNGSGRRSRAGCRARRPRVAAGVSPAVGTRWFREGGGMPIGQPGAAVGALPVVR